MWTFLIFHFFLSKSWFNQKQRQSYLCVTSYILFRSSDALVTRTLIWNKSVNAPDGMIQLFWERIEIDHFKIIKFKSVKDVSEHFTDVTLWIFSKLIFVLLHTAAEILFYFTDVILVELLFARGICNYFVLERKVL